LELKDIIIPGKKVRAKFYPIKNGTADQQKKALRAGGIALFDTPYMKELPLYLEKELRAQGLSWHSVGWTTYVKTVWTVCRTAEVTK
jgi:hypothetical protein